MTLGEKIKSARKRCALSQEQLAQKLCVSRSAVAKWETGKGMPDVENLVQLARLLNVSVDSLLSEDGDGTSPVIRETYRLADYGRGCDKVKKHCMMRDRFPGARICVLLGRPELSREDGCANSARGILTPVPFGSPEYMKSVRQTGRDFYLVEQEDGRYFVTVTDTHLEIRPFPLPPAERSFRLGGWHFVCGEDLPRE